MSSGSNAGDSAGNILKKGFGMIHGAGEAIRGNINSFADTATGTDSTKDRNIAQRGMDEMNTGHYHGTGAGVTPHDTAGEKVNRTFQGESGGVGSGIRSEMQGANTGYSSTGTTGYSTGPAGHSTNMGPHSTNLGNKLDPTVDSDASSNLTGRRV